MKNTPAQPELDRLLRAALSSEDAASCGPELATVLEMAKQERQRRHRLQAGVATAAVVFGALLLILADPKTQPSQAEAAAPVAPVSAVRPGPIQLEEINDEELLVLLEGTPTALMEWPDGRRTLLMLESSYSEVKAP